MKVRISIPGASVAVEMDDVKSRRVFNCLARELLIFGAGGGTESPASPESAVADVVLVDKAEQEEAEPPEPDQEEISERVDLEEIPEEKPAGQKYKGFMYIKCPECGHIRGFNMKKPADHFHCDSCGKRTVFADPLVPLWVFCECGKQFRYMTNMDEPMFDINCLECGAPVAVKWNEKERVYETIWK